MIVYCIYLPRSSVCLCDNWKTISIISLYIKNWNSMSTHIHHFYLFIIYLCNQMSEYHKFVLLFLKIWRRTVQCDTIWNLVIHSNNISLCMYFIYPTNCKIRAHIFRSYTFPGLWREPLIVCALFTNPWTANSMIPGILLHMNFTPWIMMARLI